MNETKTQKLERLEREHSAMVDALRQIMRRGYSAANDPAANAQAVGFMRATARITLMHEVTLSAQTLAEVDSETRTAE